MQKEGDSDGNLKNDIAAATGISVSTISRVLNQDESISVTSQTQQKILEAAQALGYVPVRSRKSEGDRTLKMGDRSNV